MLYDEFLKLSYLNISHRFYTETIEPEYTDSAQPDKETFIADWTKRNKSLICKAVSTDISALSRDLIMMDAVRADAERSRADLQAERLNRADVEIELEQARESLTCMKKENEQLRCNIKNVRAEYNKLIADYNRLLSEREQYSKKDTEIMELKALLFDLTVKA